VTLANQIRVGDGLSLIGGDLNQAIYNLGYKDQDAFFNDITTGSNGFPAEPGFDLATGWGSPKGQTFVDGLAEQDLGTLPPGFVDTTLNYSATFYASNFYPAVAGVPDSASFLGIGTIFGDGTNLLSTFQPEGAEDDGFFEVNGFLDSLTIPQGDGLDIGTDGSTVTGIGAAVGLEAEAASPVTAGTTVTVNFDLEVFFQGTLTHSSNGTPHISGTFYTVEGASFDAATNEWVAGPQVERGTGNEIEGQFATP
jgi:hypothetical protein